MNKLSVYEIASILRKFNVDFIIQNYEIYGYIPVFDSITWTFPTHKINLANISKKDLLQILNTGFVKVENERRH